MADIFDNKILCRNCDVAMKKAQIERNGFLLRALVCPKCNDKIIHPIDEREYNKFISLRNKEFSVKMRMVGNSYAVSIPKEIVSFMNAMNVHKKMMNDMVRLCFEDFGRVSLNFENMQQNKNSRVVGAREVQVVKNGKPVLHVRQFADSANPKNNKTQVFRSKQNA
ncbi:MAG: hypothetical protein PHH00_02925 [Candidatus Nanoarchaeia archaeon]|nr:hypothetical protein [Candidatus Nanoarchaeia archaeon]